RRKSLGNLQEDAGRHRRLRKLAEKISFLAVDNAESATVTRPGRSAFKSRLAARRSVRRARCSSECCGAPVRRSGPTAPRLCESIGIPPFLLVPRVPAEYPGFGSHCPLRAERLSRATIHKLVSGKTPASRFCCGRSLPKKAPMPQKGR